MSLRKHPRISVRNVWEINTKNTFKMMPKLIPKLTIFHAFSEKAIFLKSSFSSRKNTHFDVGRASQINEQAGQNQYTNLVRENDTKRHAKMISKSSFRHPGGPIFEILDGILKGPVRVSFSSKHKSIKSQKFDPQGRPQGGNPAMGGK